MSTADEARALVVVLRREAIACRCQSGPTRAYRTAVAELEAHAEDAADLLVRLCDEAEARSLLVAAAERYREACEAFARATEAKAAAERSHRAGKVDARALGVEAWDAIVMLVRAALVAAEDAHDDAFAAREAAADALLAAARGDL